MPNVIAAGLLFISFLLLLLVSLSVPIIKTIYLFEILVKVSSGLLDSGGSASVEYGVWGYCVSSLDVSVLGIQHSTAGECSKIKLGYSFDTTVASALHVNGLENLISRTLTAVLVLHPIACALTFIAFFVSLFMFRRGQNAAARRPSFLTLTIGVLAALITTSIFLVDVIMVAVIRHRVHNDTDGVLTLNWGNAVWMTLAASILLWIAMAGACSGICACGTRRRSSKADRY